MEKKRILCYGDSNTWGFIGGLRTRFDEDTRCTGRLQNLLGSDYAVVEAGLNGRTKLAVDLAGADLLVGMGIDTGLDTQQHLLADAPLPSQPINGI